MLKKRLEIELDRLILDPGEGITAWKGQIWNELYAQVIGPQDSPYSEGIFQLHLIIPDRYPFEPPHVRFITPVYHPNIDSDGRICLDTLKMQPQGSWSPSISINTLLSTIRVLLAYPNADDGLVPQITEQYRRDINGFKASAREHTLKHAQQSLTSIPKLQQQQQQQQQQSLSLSQQSQSLSQQSKNLQGDNLNELSKDNSQNLNENNNDNDEYKSESGDEDDGEDGDDNDGEDGDDNDGDEIDNDDEVEDSSYNNNNNKRSNSLNISQNNNDKKIKLY